MQWNIKSQIAGKIPVEIRYFTSGITWAADYVGIANEDETKLAITGYVRVFNNSGELYDNAQTRLVVGKINLVEKIAELARRPPPGPPAPQGRAGPRGLRRQRGQGRGHAARPASGPGEWAAWAAAWAARPPAKPKAVVKEGLSEYFLFTIEGREDIKDKEPKRLVAMKVAEVPLESIYKLSDRAGETSRFTKYYRFKNVKLLDEKGKEKKLSAMENLGLSPLPNGMVRLFSEYTNKDLAYVGGTETKYVPIGDRVEVNVGADKDITIQRRLKDQKIGNVAVRQYKRRLDDQFVSVLRPGRLRRDLLLRGRSRLRQAGRGQDRGRAAVRRRRRALGRRRAARRLDEQRAAGPTSICTRSPAAWNASISSTSSTSSISSRGRSNSCNTA